MYPYPSGPAHQGHVRNYTFGDLLVRHRTMQGFAVLSPFGFDSFGLPAENAAIRTGTHPRIFTEARIAELKASVRRLWAPSTTGGGRSAATTRRTCGGTRSSSSGCSRRAWPTGPWRRSTGARAARRSWPTSRSWPTAPASAPATSSIQRDLEQWFFRITAYADELLDRLDDPRLARAGQDHAAQLDRALRRGGVRPAGRRPRRRASPCGSSPPGPTPASA